jgi:hypothetical protein
MTEQQISAQLDELITMMAASKALETSTNFTMMTLKKLTLMRQLTKGKI